MLVILATNTAGVFRLFTSGLGRLLPLTILTSCFAIRLLNVGSRLLLIGLFRYVGEAGRFVRNHRWRQEFLVWFLLKVGRVLVPDGRSAVLNRLLKRRNGRVGILTPVRIPQLTPGLLISVGILIGPVGALLIAKPVVALLGLIARLPICPAVIKSG